MIKQQKGQTGSNIKNTEQKSYLSNSKIAVPVLVFAVLLAFAGGFGNGFVYWDDPSYVTDNPLIQSPGIAGLIHLLRSECMFNYHPLTMASLWLNSFLFGKGALSFIIANTFIHIFNTTLIYFFTRQLSSKNSLVPFFTALLWGLHPMHVESVSWVSERKDLLYTFFFLLSCIQYTYFLETEKRKYLIYTIVFFLLSCLSKGMAVVLPFVLILLDYWFDRKWYSPHYLIQKIPFFIIAIFFGLLAIHVQDGGNLGGFIEKLSQSGDSALTSNLPFIQRICFASYALLVYIFKLFVPVHQHNFYAYPLPDQYNNIQYLLAPFAVLILLIFTVMVYRRQKVFFFGILFFLFTIVMVLQLLPTGSALLAERYTYLSYFGLIFMLVYWLNAHLNKTALTYALSSVSVIFITLCYYQTQTYKDTATLFLNSYQYEPASERIDEILVINYCMNGDYEKALNIGQKAIEQGIASWKLLVFMGKSAYLQKNFRQAAVLLKKAAAIAPANKISTVYLEQSLADRALGNYRESISDLDKAILSDSIHKPDISSTMFYERAVSKKLYGQYEPAIADFSEAIRLDSSKLGNIIKDKAFSELLAGQWQQAIKDYTTMLNLGISPDAAYNNRGGARFKLGDTVGAVQDFKSALSINPNYTDAKNNLARAGVNVR